MLCCLILWVCWSGSAAADDWWPRLRAAADRCYDGWAAQVDLRLSAGGRDDALGGGGAVSVSVPIYAPAVRQRQQERRTAYLRKGAEALRQLERAERVRQVLRERVHYLEAVLAQGGEITAYLTALESLADTDAQIGEAQRRLEALVTQCDEEAR